MNVGLFVKDFASGKKFSKNGLPEKSGAEFHAENHARQLILRGHQVTIFAKKRHFFTKAREWLDGIDLVRLHEPFRGGEILLRLFTTHRNIDAIYILGIPKFAAWAVLAAHWRHIPVTMALTRRDEIFSGDDGWRNRIFRTCTNYIAISHEIQQGLLERGGIPSGKITVLPQGIDCTRFSVPSAGRKAELRTQHGIPVDAHVLLFCARLVPDKGTGVVQRIWPEIHRRDPQARLLVVGGGLHEVVQDLREMAHQTDDSAMIVGEVDDPQVYDQMADLYIFPSHQEGLPTSLLEAMSCGLPAVCSDIGGCDDLVFDGITGYRLPVEDDAVFLEKTWELLADDEKRHRMAERAAAFVRRIADYGNVIEHLAAVIGDKSTQGQDFLRKPEPEEANRI